MTGEQDPPVGELEGSLAATLARVADGVARIELKGSLEAEEESKGDLSDVPVAEGTTTVRTRTSYAIEGSLLWDLRRGHLAGAEIGAELEVLIDTQKDPGQDGPDFASLMTLAGTWRLQVEIVVP